MFHLLFHSDARATVNTKHLLLLLLLLSLLLLFLFCTFFDICLTFLTSLISVGRNSAGNQNARSNFSSYRELLKFTVCEIILLIKASP